MPIIKPKPTKTKKATRQVVKAKSTALVKAKNPKASKNTLAYYQCLCHQTKQGLKGKKITSACRDCKHNALAINAKMSTQKLKDIKKLAQAHANFKQILEEYVQKH